jgi:hypothetical protein
MPTVSASRDALLAGYVQRSEEIGRRSTLLWAGATGYLVFVFAAFNAVLNRSVEIVVWSMALWIVAVMGYAFMYSQWREIARLAQENQQIANSLESVSKVPWQPRLDHPNTPIGWVIDQGGLLCAVFLMLPAALNGLAAIRNAPERTMMLAIGLVGSVILGTMLVTHRMPQP